MKIEESKQALPQEQLRLGSGQQCVLAEPLLPGVRGYFVLALPAGASCARDASEFHLLVHRVARQLAMQHAQDAEAYAVMYCAGRTRRKPWPHAHILIGDSVSARRRAVVLLQLKPLLRMWQRAAGTLALCSRFERSSVLGDSLRGAHLLLHRR